MVQGTVHHCSGSDFFSEDIAPLAEWQVTGKDDGCFLIPVGDELEEQVRCVLVKGQVADFINNQQRDLP